MIVLAGAFLTFLGFLVAGLLALVITAALDRSLGKEKALLLWAGVLLLFTLWQCTPDHKAVVARAKTEKTVPDALIDVSGDPFDRPSLTGDIEARNPFRKHSDTRPLPPITLEDPPWPPLPFSLPPTIPGPAPGARYLLRAELPTLATGDGTTIPEMPAAVFADYVPIADDVYDHIVDDGRKAYIYLRAIKQDGQWHQEGQPRFEALKWTLVRRTQGFDQLEVDLALVGNEEVASKRLEPTDVLRARRANRYTKRAEEYGAWVLRANVDNLYAQILRTHGLLPDPAKSADIAALRAAAKDLAEVGRTGKEDRAGWRRAAALLEMALTQARERGVPGLRAEILEELVEAYAELRDEQAVMRALAEYARISPARPEPWLWLGELHLRRLGLAEEALDYFRAALKRAPRNTRALLGEGDALTALGRHREALASYRKGGAGYDAKVRVAESALRLGDMGTAAAAAQAALGRRNDGPRALLAHGGILYAQGDLEPAYEAFAQAATAPSDVEGALEFRAQACYDLGIAAWRMGKADAAIAAFEACDTAMRFGASPQRFGDETVSPAFGRALIELGTGNVSAFLSSWQEAKEEAPAVSYHDYLAGATASREGNDAIAVRAFDRALRLVPVYPELDGWLARTRLNLGRQALAAGTPIEETAQDFAAAVAFAARASANAERADKNAFRPDLREAWIRIGAENVPVRPRFEEARAVADKVLKRIDREQPAALTLRGYCNYRLAEFGMPPGVIEAEDPYEVCIRDFQQVLNKVPSDDTSEWRAWRDYAEKALTQIKHWRSLEEKVVTFEETSLPAGWKQDERFGIRGRVEDGVLRVSEVAKRDGSLVEPTWFLANEAEFTVGSFEEVRMLLRIPSRTAGGVNMNTITIGVQVQRTSSRGGLAKQAGIGGFYDRGKIAARVGGGRDEAWKDGELHRIQPEREWPDQEWVEVRIVRENADEGRMAVYVNGERIVEDVIGAFRGQQRSRAQLWIGGYSTQAQPWDVQVKDIRIIRRTGR